VVLAHFPFAIEAPPDPQRPIHPRRQDPQRWAAGHRSQRTCGERHVGDQIGPGRGRPEQTLRFPIDTLFGDRDRLEDRHRSLVDELQGTRECLASVLVEYLVGRLATEGYEVDAVTALLEDTYYAVTAPERIGQGDLIEKLEEIARETPRPKLISAIDAIGNLKKELQYNVNRQLALEAMFLNLSSRRQ